MSQPRPDTSFRPNRIRSHDLSTPQLRALRKELLLVRAAVERAEMSESIVELRSAVTNFSWLRFVVPGFSRSGSSGGGVGAGLGNLLKQYPLLSSLVSLIVAKPLRTSLVSAARPVIKWGGLAFTAWEAYRVWQQVRRQRGAAPGRASRNSSDEDDLTG
ncbi:DUF3318 domain-containing protein [Paraburkholderia unamae]|uniref:Uncharacterized protein DUF3318 n=1 Tax=Paraburkholderia unamae TaxID=219649 RepID=A0ABX5KJS5_9BURK|nr:DUF3318 domain-containing protein [Paraburkholderia unamae]PVX77840.1 uncharacterized protein DUF3318 [Paraburkholderia unamae]CAG9256551.1 conserved hypothetical protein [Paraburkholderia unamae]